MGPARFHCATLLTYLLQPRTGRTFKNVHCLGRTHVRVNRGKWCIGNCLYRSRPRNPQYASYGTLLGAGVQFFFLILPSILLFPLCSSSPPSPLCSSSGASSGGSKTAVADSLYDPSKQDYHPVDDACWQRGQK